MSSFCNPDPDAKSSPITIERVVAALTPLFAAGSGWVSTEIAKLVNVNIPASDFTAIFIAGAVSASAAALKWLHGRSQYVNLTKKLQSDARSMDHGLVGQLVASPSGQDIEALLRAHESNIIDALGEAVGAGPKADQIAQQIIQQLWPSKAAEHAATVAPAGGAGAAS